MTRTESHLKTIRHYCENILCFLNMLNAIKFIKPIFMILILTLALTACSRFTYNNLDWLMYWYLEEYVEVSTEQNKVVEKNIDKVLKWHRKIELIKYRQQLLQISLDVKAGDIRYSVWLQHIQQIREHWLRVRNKLNTALSNLAVTMSPNQVKELFINIKEVSEDKEEDYHDLSERELRKERIEKISDRFENLLGSINKAQEKAIKLFVKQAKSSRLESILYKREMQKAAKQLIKTVDKKDLANQLYELLAYPEEFQSMEFRQIRTANVKLFANMLQSIVIELSEKQRAHVHEKIQELIILLNKLIFKDN